jgi:2-isopropylmalate synthase
MLSPRCARRWRPGATVVLCDTNGGCMTDEVGAITRTVAAELGPEVVLGIHVHDDAGLSVANSLIAVAAGAVHVQGTINGYGERCGNADLVTIWANLALKLGRPTVPAGDDLSRLPELSRFVAEVANIAPDAHAPYVGTSAFAHKGGVHGAATIRVDKAYQHVEPAVVGGQSRLVVSELGGKANAGWRVRQLGELDRRRPRPAELSTIVKQLESEGASFEGADASFELLVRRRRPDYRPPFRIVDFTVIVEPRDLTNAGAEASVKVEVDGEVLHTAADGNGPVHALDLALRKALGAFYPTLDAVHLVDYKVRIVDGDAATGARTRVIIETAHETGTWITAGADTNIIAASLAALHDSLEYAIWRLDARPERRDERSSSHAATQRRVPQRQPQPQPSLGGEPA